jgi:hypothetical protein
MTKETKESTAVLQGALDMLILRTLLYGPARAIRLASTFNRLLMIFCRCKWETAPDRNRKFKYYRLTEKGRKKLLTEESQWKKMTEAVALVMWPVGEEN